MSASAQSQARDGLWTAASAGSIVNSHSTHANSHVNVVQGQLHGLDASTHAFRHCKKRLSSCLHCHGCPSPDCDPTTSPRVRNQRNPLLSFPTSAFAPFAHAAFPSLVTQSTAQAQANVQALAPVPAPQMPPSSAAPLRGQGPNSNPNAQTATASTSHHSSSSAMATAASSNSHSHSHSHSQQSHADLDGDDIRSRFPWFSGDTQSPFFPSDSSSISQNPLKGDTHHRTYAATPLILAVLAGNVRAVAQLVSRFQREGTLDHDLEATDSLGRTPLIACIFGVDTLEITADNLPLVSQVHPTHAAIFDLLVSQVKDVRVFERGHACIHHISPFILASYLGKTHYVRRMLERGCHVDCTDTQNGTALMYAARDNHLAVVEVLLEYNASVDRTDDNGWSALDYGEKYDEVRELLEAAPHLPLSDEEEDDHRDVNDNGDNQVDDHHDDHDEQDMRSFEARQHRRATSPSLETPPSSGVTYPSTAPANAPFVKHAEHHAHFQPHFSESQSPHASAPAVAPAAAPTSRPAPPAHGHHPMSNSTSTTNSTSQAAAAAADARLDQMYQEYCKVADMANSLRASESFWTDRWHELAMHVLAFVDAVSSPMAQVAGIARVPLNSFMSGTGGGGEGSLSINDPASLEPPTKQSTQTTTPVPPQLDALATALATKTNEVHQLASHVAALKSKRDQASHAPAPAPSDLQTHAADLTMALADLMRIESQRRRLATAVAADHQRKVASKWRAEAQAAKLEAAKLRAALGDVPTSSARDADWKRVQTQLGAVTKALGGTPDPIDASRPVSPTPITLALDQIATRVHHLDAQLRQVREHNVRLLRELDSKDVSVRLLESQVNWLKVNHETVAHQQSQALALQAHTIHSLASGAGAAGSVSVAAGMTPRRPSTSTLTGGGQQMTDAARAAQWEAQGPSRAATATPGRQAQRGGGHSHHARQVSAEYPYHHHGHHEDEYDDDDDHSLSLMAPARRPSAIRSHHDQAADPRVRMPRSTSRQPASQSTPSPNPSRRPPSLPADIHRHPRRSSLDASASRAAAHARHVSSEHSLAGSSSVLVSDDEYSSSIATPIRDRQRSAGMDSRYTSVRAAAAVGAASASVPQRAEVPESLRSGRTGREVEVKDRDKDREREREKGGWGWTQSLARKVKKIRSTSDLRR